MGKGAAVTSLVSGIVAFVVPLVGPVAAAVAVIAGLYGRHKRQGAIATAGLILGIVYWVLAIIAIVVAHIFGLFHRFADLFP